MLDISLTFASNNVNKRMPIVKCTSHSQYTRFRSLVETGWNIPD